MPKYDIYLYDDCKVLKNKLNIKDEEALDLAEADLSRANMMILYNSGFYDFSVKGICEIHKTLFEDVYDWAGKFRVINIQKGEKILAGKSVWYSDCDSIEKDLKNIFGKINKTDWKKLDKESFVKKIAEYFSSIWQVHPFREGNTRTVTMLLAFFVENKGYYFDHDLIANSAGYFRDALVMASLDKFSEYEHLEKILNDAICTEPIGISNEKEISKERKDKYEKYKYENYKPTSHEYLEKQEH